MEISHCFKRIKHSHHNKIDHEQTICDRARENLPLVGKYFFEIRADFASPIFSLPILQISCG